MKTCTICKDQKPLSEFNKQTRSKDGHQNVCRECNRQRSRQYYDENRSKHIKVVRQKKDLYVRRNKQWVNQIKAYNGCAVCNEKEVCCLDFHHVDGKSFTISTAVCGAKSNVQTILEEIRRCACVCRNCHAKIHAGLTVLTEDQKVKVPPEGIEPSTYRLKAGCSAN